MMRREAIGLVLAVLPWGASAHLVTTGLGPVYDGIGHFLLSVEAVLPVLALILPATLGGPVFARRAALALAGAWVLGAALTLLALEGLPSDRVAGVAAAVVLLLGGGLAAMDRFKASILVAMLGGLCLGAAEGHALAVAADGLRMVVGSFASVLVVASLAAGAGVALARAGAWQRVTLRVAGSWLAGVGLLMLGWALRPVAAG